MAITILNSVNSFVRFNETIPEPHCIWGDVNFCLPVYEQGDVNFQFVIQGTEAEIDSLCTQDGSNITVSLVPECDGEELITFSEKPQRFRLSETQALFNWSHGLPNFSSVVEIGQCFKIQVEAVSVYDTVFFCSNCFERIGDNCFTSVIEYGSDQDGFGFKYCYAGELEGDAVGQDCDPTIAEFFGVATLSIPYTTALKNKYGNFPTVQAWIYDEAGQLVNMGITIEFDSYPPNTINLDFGGVSSGIVIIR